MNENHLVRTLKGNPVINIETGEKIASLEDLLVAPDNLSIQAVVTSKGNILNRKIEAIEAEHVRVWGKDAVLVDSSAIAQPQEYLAGFENWVTLFDDLKGRTVVSVDGKRVGPVNDFHITSDGKLVSIELSDVFVEGPVAETKEIPMDSVRSLGPDVVIVDLQSIEPVQPVAVEPEDIQHETVEPESKS